MKIIQLPLICLISLFSCSYLMAKELPKPLVETDWLANNLHQVFIIDARKTKESFASKPIFRKDKKTKKTTLLKVGGHIPNAKLVLYENIRGDQKVDGVTVKYMLPDKSQFETQMQNIGLNNDDSIVIVTNAENNFDVNMAARVYWQIKYYGHDEVAILNGGTAQWIVDGHDVASTHNQINVGNWQAKKLNQELVADSHDVTEAITNKNTQLIDVRPLGQYLGIHKSSKVKAHGHIPTSKSYPVELVSNSIFPVKFLSANEIQDTLNALDINPDNNSITYCNSGHMAAGGWFALSALLGNENVKLYDGSMHQWSLENRSTVKMKMQ